MNYILVYVDFDSTIHHRRKLYCWVQKESSDFSRDCFKPTSDSDRVKEIINAERLHSIQQGESFKETFNVKLKEFLYISCTSLFKY